MHQLSNCFSVVCPIILYEFRRGLETYFFTDFILPSEYCECEVGRVELIYPDGILNTITGWLIQFFFIDRDIFPVRVQPRPPSLLILEKTEQIFNFCFKCAGRPGRFHDCMPGCHIAA